MMGSCGGKKCGAASVAHWLLVIGGLNWLLVGLAMWFGGTGANWNVVNLLLGPWANLEALVYVLVGLSALVCAFGCPCKTCKEGASA